MLSKAATVLWHTVVCVALLNQNLDAGLTKDLTCPSIEGACGVFTTVPDIVACIVVRFILSTVMLGLVWDCALKVILIYVRLL